MRLSYTVTGRTKGEIDTAANKVLGEFMKPDGHYSYGMGIEVSPLVDEFGTETPSLWQGEVTVTDLRAKSLRAKS